MRPTISAAAPISTAARSICTTRTSSRCSTRPWRRRPRSKERRRRPSASARRQTMTIICSTRMTTRTPAWHSASSSAALSRWFPRLWRRPGFRARTPICSSSTTSREISQSTACSVGGEGPSSPTRRSCSVPIPKGACGRYRVVTIPVVHLERGPIQTGSAVELRNERFRHYSVRKDRPQCPLEQK